MGQNPAVAGQTGSAVVDTAVLAEGRIGGRQNKTNFEVDLQTEFAAVREDSLARRPCWKGLSPD